MNMLTNLLQNPMVRVVISLLVAFIPVLLLNRFFIRQMYRYWLGFNDGAMGWKRLFASMNFHFSYSKDVELSFIRAGIYNPRLAALYFPAKIKVGLLIFVIVFFLGERFGIAEPMQRLAAAFVGIVLVILLPDVWLQHRQKKRIRKISTELPYVCDLMSVCVQTGMTIEASMTYLASELQSFDQDLAYVVRRVDTLSRVAGMQHALEEMAEHYPTNQVRSFVYTLSQSLQYGSSIFEVLTRLSANLREIEMLELEEKVGKLSAKMSVPLILFIMFPIVFLITAPGIIRMMGNG